MCEKWNWGWWEDCAFTLPSVFTTEPQVTMFTQLMSACSAQDSLCITTAMWRCRNPFSQWQRNFQWKLRSHWLKFVPQRHGAVIKWVPVLMKMCWNAKKQIANFMGPTWGPPWSCRTQMSPMLAPWTLLQGRRVSRDKNGCLASDPRTSRSSRWTVGAKLWTINSRTTDGAQKIHFLLTERRTFWLPMARRSSCWPFGHTISGSCSVDWFAPRRPNYLPTNAPFK